MSAPVVRINSDSAEKIATLYRVGLKTAQEIVAYREQHGPFTSPEDLARVRTVSPDLARVLSSQIDWGAGESTGQLTNRNWWVVLWGLSIIVLALMPIYNNTAALRLIFDVSILRPTSWYLLPLGVLFFGFLICFLFTGAALIASGISRDQAQRTWWRRAALLAFEYVVLFLLVTRTGSLIARLFFTPSALSSLEVLRSATQDSFALAYFFITTPILLVLWKSHLAESKLLSRIFNLAILFGGLLMILHGFSYQNPYLALVLYQLVFGASLIWYGGRSFRSGEAFQEVIKFFAFPSPHQDEMAWQQWINGRLPDPAEQVELRDALIKMHPPTSSRLRWIFILLSLWLVDQASGAVIEWVVQNWLNQFGW